MKIFCERLKEIRQKLNLNQTQFAEKIGVSQAAIARWESGVHIPNIVSLKNIALALGVTSDFLLGLDDYE